MLLLLGAAGLAWAQLSKPIAHEDNVDAAGNKYLQREAHQDAAINALGCVPTWGLCSRTECGTGDTRGAGRGCRRAAAARPPARCLPAAATRYRACTLRCREVSDEVVDRATCPQNIALKWHTEIGSAVYATPLITDLYSDGRKDIIVPGFVHNLEVRQRGC